MIEIIINENDQNKRLDKFVKKILPKAPDSFIYKLFRKKDIKVNKKPKQFDYITCLNDVVAIYVTKEQENDFTEKMSINRSKSRDFKIIYEDENILVVNKPAKLLVHDGDGKLKNEDTLTRQVLDYLIETQAYDYQNENSFIPALAHRIDRNTSGIVVFGKNSIALQELFKAFKNHEGMEKEYETLVCGKVLEKGKVEAKLIKNEKTKIVDVDEANGLNALSYYEPIHVYNDVSLVKVKIMTGRTHQIRVHMKYINHPLVGDGKYGNHNSDLLAKKYNMNTYYLHAKRLCFHNFENKLAYLNGKEFIAPLFENEIQLIDKINQGEM